MCKDEKEHQIFCSPFDNKYRFNLIQELAMGIYLLYGGVEILETFELINRFEKIPEGSQLGGKLLD